VGDEECHACCAISCESGAAIKAKPADPKHRRANHNDGWTMRHRQIIGEAFALTEHKDIDEGRDTGCRVNNKAACKVCEAFLKEPPCIRPYPMGDRGINDEKPNCRKAPTIRAGVITANVIWKARNVDSGIVPLTASRPRFFKNRLSNPPHQLFAEPKAIEYPATTQTIDIRAAMA